MMSKLKCQSTHSLSQQSSSTWTNAPNWPKNQSLWKKPIYQKHTVICLPFLCCLSVPMSHKWPRFSSPQLVMTKRKRHSKGNAFSVATSTKFLYWQGVLFLCPHPYLPLPAWHHRTLCPPRWTPRMWRCQSACCVLSALPVTAAHSCSGSKTTGRAMSHVCIQRLWTTNNNKKKS